MLLLVVKILFLSCIRTMVNKVGQKACHNMSLEPGMIVCNNHSELGSENWTITSRKHMTHNNIITSAQIEGAGCLNNLSIKKDWSQLVNQVVYHQGWPVIQIIPTIMIKGGEIVLLAVVFIIKK